MTALGWGLPEAAVQFLMRGQTVAPPAEPEPL